MPRLFMVMNEDYFLLSHRKELALRAQEAGYDVTIVAKNTGRKREVEALGLKMIELPINPTGESIAEELKTFLFLLRLYRTQRPDLVHHVGLKVILWGGLAARIAHVPGVLNAVSGLGILFSRNPLSTVARGILRVQRFSNRRKNVSVLFQNHEDEALYWKYKVIEPERTAFIKGSGIDLKSYAYTPEPESDVVKVIFTARMVREKGTMVLIEAAEMLRGEFQGKAEFWLCGGLSKNPNAISEAELRACCDGNYIKWLGWRSDVRELLMQSHIVAFPSYYREGVPKSLIEAAAIGRPIVTTRSIGCKDTVEDGVNGFLIPIKDSRSLAEKLRVLLTNPSLRKEMGRASRRIAERDFDLNQVIAKHLEIYKHLLAGEI